MEQVSFTIFAQWGEASSQTPSPQLLAFDGERTALILVDPTKRKVTNRLLLQHLLAVQSKSVKQPEGGFTGMMRAVEMKSRNASSLRGGNRRVLRLRFEHNGKDLEQQKKPLTLMIIPRYERDFDAILLSLYSSKVAKHLDIPDAKSEAAGILQELREKLLVDSYNFLPDMNVVVAYDAESLSEAGKDTLCDTRPRPRFSFPSGVGDTGGQLVVGLAQSFLCLARVVQSEKSDDGITRLLLFKEKYADIVRAYFTNHQTFLLQFAGGRVLCLGFGPSTDIAGTVLTILGRLTLEHLVEPFRGPQVVSLLETSDADDQEPFLDTAEGGPSPKSDASEESSSVRDVLSRARNLLAQHGNANVQP